FQAEDGIRDFHVTGVQTCALPIYPRSVLYRSPRLGDVFAEALAIHREDAPVVPAVARDLMPARNNFPQQRTVALGDPAEGKERRLRIDLVEQVENLAHIAVDPVRQAAPVSALDHLFESADMEPVLDVDRQPVDDRALVCRRGACWIG